MIKRFGLSIVALLALTCASWAQSPPTVKLCNGAAAGCPLIGASNPLPVTGTFSSTISGFTPGGTYANLTATVASASVALPAGTVVAFQNTGTATVSCNLGVGSAVATANQIQVPPSSTIFVTVGSNTFGACIDQTGSASNVVVLAGGSGLGTGFGGGGGSGGGGGGAVTIASGAVASGAYSSGSIASGAYASGSIASGAMVDLGAIADAAATAGGTGTLSAKLRLMTTQLGTLNTTLGTPFQAAGALGASTANIGNVLGSTNTTMTDCGGTVTTGGTAQNAFGAASTRHGFILRNLSTTTLLYWSLTTAASTSATTSAPLYAATTGSESYYQGFGPSTALSVIASDTSHPFFCMTW